jgi:hypothetical protein
MKTWKEAREMIKSLCITEQKNDVLVGGQCQFGSEIIHFNYNTKIKKVTSTSYLQDMSTNMGFCNGEKNVPYLITQAIEWSLNK